MGGITKTNRAWWSAGLAGIGVAVVVFFRNAFSTPFFADDYAFLQLSQAENRAEFFAFFAPGKEYFYRPLSTEVFYWLIQQAPDPMLLGHLIAFTTFGIGLVILFATLNQITGGRTGFAMLATAFYGLSFTHVFQLYWLATYQELLMTTLLLAAFWALVHRRFALMLLMSAGAMLAKETAVVFPLLVAVVVLLVPAWRPRGRQWGWFGGMILASVTTLLLSQSGIAQNEASQVEYQILLQPGLIINNLIWYLLWSLGLPQHLPDYLTSLTAPPIPEYQQFLTEPVYRWYLQSLAGYWIGMLLLAGILVIRLVQTDGRAWCRSVSIGAMLAMASFGIFVLPFLPIVHRWMVRLTVPQIGVAVLQAGLIYLVYRLVIRSQSAPPPRWLRWGTAAVAVATVVLYPIWNYAGVQIHEQISTYRFEAAIYQNAQAVFVESEDEIRQAGVVRFVAPELSSDQSVQDAWFGVTKLQNSFSDQAAAGYFFPGADVTFVYGDEARDGTDVPDQNPSPQSEVIISSDLIIPKP